MYTAAPCLPRKVRFLLLLFVAGEWRGRQCVQVRVDGGGGEGGTEGEGEGERGREGGVKSAHRSS